MRDYFVIDMVWLRDYYPFGAVMPGRSGGTSDTRYGFSGKEKDDELYGEGNSYDFGARMYNPRLGRWMSLDPLASKYPDASPYSYCNNTPILLVDVGGKTFRIYYEVKNEETGKTKQTYVDFDGTKAIMEDGTDYYMCANQFVDDVITSYQYIVNNGADVDNALSTLATSDKLVKVEFSEKGTYYDDKTDVLLYNPLLGLLIPDDGEGEKAGISSPASTFYHEGFHAFIDLILSGTNPELKKELDAPSSPGNTSQTKSEEYIVEREDDVAKKLNDKGNNEAYRVYYGQEDDMKDQYTTGPTSTTSSPKKEAKEKLKERNQKSSDGN